MHNTPKISGDEYIAVLQQRQAAWLAAHPAVPGRRPLPPLLTTVENGSRTI